MAIKIFIILLCANCLLAAQAEKSKWGQKEISYEIPVQTSSPGKPDLSINKVTDVVTKPVMAAYTYLFSEVDGDRCPFVPTCSSFLREGLRRTNILSAVFLAADRLTRDTNPTKSGRLYKFDPYRHRLLDPFDDYIECGYQY